MSHPQLYEVARAEASGAFAPPSTPDAYRHMTDSPEHESADAATFGAPSRQDTRTDAALRADTRDDTTTVSGASPKPRKRRLGWLRKGDGLGQWNPALTLENSGSVARDHLASERTFLAYVRTSLTIASTGVALVQLFTISAATSNHSLEAYSRPIGAVVICVGLATLALGLTRYFAIQNALIDGNYPVARVSTMLLALVMMAIIVVVFGIIVGVRSKP
ncbi:DUF202 domain-containing protein [Phanerochaete sordida]|uniref:DUF202 domain-containing protein n=1 Tax=Phanerochaete sordida TaxID=48140 RepID=A0A9P3LEV3_9APHY|nr:DUF202 domain-containing protein [Phanerochaete sordida]